jgi:hypothetical protein
MFPTTQNSATSLAGMLAETKVQAATNNAGKAYLKFDFKTGGFSFGRELEDVTNETIIVNTHSIQHGWTLWVNGSPQKVSAAFNQELPAPMESAGGNDPSESRSFEARFEDDEDTILVFDSNSYGGRSGVDSLLNEIKARASSGETEYLFPKIKLESSNYKAKQGSTVYNPNFTVVGWVNMDGDLAVETAKIAVEEVEESAPVRRRRAS